jgi:hypothetical protein
LPGKIIKVDLKDCDAGQTPFKYIGEGNFTENGDGFSNSGYNGYKRAEDIIGTANAELQNNADQWRKANDINVQNPIANVTYPSTPPQVKVRYLLTGVYFHRNESAYYLQTSRADIHTQYGVNPTTTINVYYTPNGSWSGIANNLGGSEKYVFNNDYFTYVKPVCKDWSIHYSAQLFNHEIGHTLGLSHTWNEDDYCIDTPKGFVYDKWEKINNTFVCILNQNANCWAFSTTIPTCPTSTGGKPCDSWSKVSNNMMDYNQYAPHAVTTCQVARINSELSDAGNLFVHSCNGCIPSNAFFDIPDVYKICPTPLPGGGYFLNGVASVNENKWLIDICEVDPANPSVCIGNNINTGWQNGQIGKVNLKTYYNFQINKSYRVKLIVDNTNCPLSSEYSRVIQTKSCSEEMLLVGNPIEFAASNPFNEQLTVFYNVKTDGKVQFRLINVFTAQISKILSETDTQVGEYQLNYNTSSIPSGTYSLQAIFNEAVYTKNIIKQ